ncbi:MAG: hypothetical protein WDM89_16935 [Rhizomicrobium sp.]
MSKLDIGVGQDFPIEEKLCAEDRGCSGHGYRHHFHHENGSVRDMWRRRFGRRDATEQNKDKE